MYYENFEKLCQINSVKPSHVSKATGISTATLTSWKKGTYTPKQDKLQLIADYFQVSVDYIMTGKEKTSDFTPESASLVAKIRNDAELTKALEKYFAMTPDKKKHVIDTINMLSEG